MISGAYRIVTERLTLRCWSPSDAPALKAAVDANREHLKNMPWARFEPMTLDDRITLLRQFRARVDLNQELIYGIFENGAITGACGLHPRVGDGAAEIGYWIAADRVGNGLATETAAALTRVGFELEKLARVEIHCAPTNHASANVARKLGYTHEATLRGRGIDGAGQPRDTMFWTLFAEDYPKTPSPQRAIQVFDAAERRIL
jgi:RimJ/RimL family protein N-acetyltransferase